MQVNLSWAAVTNALYYNVFRGTTTGGPYQKIGQSNPSASNPTLTYQDGPGNLTNGQSYFYVISSVTADGESAYSAEFAATAPSAPASPGSFTGIVT